MDGNLRELQREAAVGDSEARARLEAGAQRVGAEWVVYLGPREVPVRHARPVRRDVVGLAGSGSRASSRVGSKRGVGRHRTQVASSADALERGLERVARRAGRSACEEGYQDWLEDRED